jgi:predicted negative regulator of RcsB-dependent stress response
VARARLLQGEILAARGHLEGAVAPLSAAVELAERLGTRREVWLGRAALGHALARLGRDVEAEASFASASQTIESIADELTTSALRRSFLGAEPVSEVYRVLGRRPPVP